MCKKVNRVREMFKNQLSIKMACMGMAILMPTLFGLFCGFLNLIPPDSLDQQVYVATLLPEWLSQINGLHLYALALLFAMIIIMGILAGIVLTRIITSRVTKS